MNKLAELPFRHLQFIFLILLSDGFLFYIMSINFYALIRHRPSPVTPNEYNALQFLHSMVSFAHSRNNTTTTVRKPFTNPPILDILFQNQINIPFRMPTKHTTPKSADIILLCLIFIIYNLLMSRELSD